MSLDYPSAVLRPPFRRAYRLPYRSPAGIETIIANALADINADDLVGVTTVTEIPNSGLGGTGFDYDSPLGTPANGQPHPFGSVRFFGANGDFLSTPQSAALNTVSGEGDFIVRVILGDYTPAAIVTLISRYTTAGNRNWIIELGINGTLTFFSITDGTNVSKAYNSTSTISAVASAGQEVYIRVKFLGNNGSSNSNLTFEYSLQNTKIIDDIIWIQLGNVVHKGSVDSLFAAGSSGVEIGSLVGGTVNRLSGSVSYASIASTIDGTPLAVMNPADQTNSANVSGSTWPSKTTGEVWTQNGDTPINNTGHKELTSIGGYGLETTAGQDIAIFTRFIVGRFLTVVPGANQVLFDARSNAGKSVSLFSDNANSNKLTLDAGGTPIAIAGAYDNDLHVFTVVSNGANSLLRVSGVGEIVGNPGSEVLDYGTILAALGAGSSAPFSYNRDLTFNSALSGARIAQIEDALAQKYKGVQV